VSAVMLYGIAGGTDIVLIGAFPPCLQADSCPLQGCSPFQVPRVLRLPEHVGKVTIGSSPAFFLERASPLFTVQRPRLASVTTGDTEKSQHPRDLERSAQIMPLVGLSLWYSLCPTLGLQGSRVGYSVPAPVMAQFFAGASLGSTVVYAEVTGLPRPQSLQQRQGAALSAPSRHWDGDSAPDQRSAQQPHCPGGVPAARQMGCIRLFSPGRLSCQESANTF
jgi:hypothetical protein